ncbi:MAG: cofactor-independent phosphoglycerate mutase [Candidatus Dadabacteria bacterium]|nr:cofactor-independent phosphoglycerate mutase [Candidatus Dadabacteria bacterium]MYA48737.1 cofactor-independent phosphoglycerate mutase [Candidatus Dadabacteria bacterium]MYF48466.1 cofactor-independent phosphoglycerate mutase [Candidatus Dadabacteria bacterium]MYG83038.1 cofactor-independent phosphoglycerate mutase [Candidatus Dadabacteria bacterium]MYK49722.1 cofactor-independent phosphoglycerate mutase [Candidatus Dadabacteria bacterium]
MKYLILQGDGMPDHKLPELDGRTPLEAADTPNLDEIAKRAEIFGIAKTIPDPLPPGSDVGNLAVLGYDPTKYYTGRSPLEAASIGVSLGETDVAVRCNLVTLAERNGRTVMEDYSAGHITDDDAAGIIEDLKKEFDGEEFSLSQGVSYRHLLLWRGGNSGIRTTPPHDISGKEIAPWLPSGDGAEKLLSLMEKSRRILKDHPVNAKRRAEGKNTADSVWLWGEGTRPDMPPLQELYGITGSVVSAVDLVKGIGIFASMEVIEVPGATGYLDTNYAGKVSGAIESLRRVDLAMIHIEATDETGHVGDARLKIRAIEDFDQKVVGPALAGMEQFGEYRVLVLSDHPTPIDLRTHTNEPVPFAILDSENRSVKNGSLVYTEDSAASSGIFVEQGWKLMGTLVAR